MSTRTRVLLAVCVFAALTVAAIVGGLASASAEPAGPTAEPVETTVIDGARIPADVRPVVVVSGSDYDMGYQRYQQLAEIFGLGYLQDMKQTFTDEDLVSLKAYQWYVQESMPELIEQLKGMAAGATDAGVPMSYAEALANELSLKGVKAYPGTEPPGSQDDTLPPSGCSGFVAWGSTTKDGKLIAAGSLDAEHGGDGYVLVAFPETGNDYIIMSQDVWDHVGHPGMNNKGLVYAHHGAGESSREAASYATIGFMGTSGEAYVHHTLRFADNAAQALDMTMAYPPGSRAHGLWADTSGDAFNAECRDPRIVRRAGDNGEQDFLYATNNSLAAGFKPVRAWLANAFGWDITFVPHGGWTAMDEDAVRRNLVMWNMLHNYRGKVDLEFVKMMWRFPGRLPDYPSLEAADEGMYANQSAGWDSKICALGNEAIGICQPDDGDKGLYYAINGPATSQANAQCPGYAFWTPGETHTFYEVQLAADPEAVVSAAHDRAMYDLSYANIELRKLTYADTAFAPLKEIFDKAVAEWYKARHAQDLAGETTGNEAVGNWAKALRGFTRCQAYANQVYEALVPQPDDPKDLGLKKYWGGWGDWTSWLGSH